MTDRLATKGRHRWLLISIRSLMGLVLVTAVGCGWLVQRARAQRKAIAEIRRHRGTFNYDWQARDPRGARNATPPGPEWLRKLVGDESFQEVNSITFLRRPIDDSTLACIGALKGLKELQVFG